MEMSGPRVGPLTAKRPEQLNRRPFLFLIKCLFFLAYLHFFSFWLPFMVPAVANSPTAFSAHSWYRATVIFILIFCLPSFLFFWVMAGKAFSDEGADYDEESAEVSGGNQARSSRKPKTTAIEFLEVTICP